MTSTNTITTTRPREVGNLHVGDVVLLDTDIFATVTGFTFPENTGYAYGYIVVVEYDVTSRTLRSDDTVWVAVKPATACVVDHGKDGLTLWDCECRACRRLQREARMDDDC